MKGRNNYLCRKKLYDLTDQPVLSGLEEIEQYRAIAAWEKTTATGDRAELAELPETSALWHKLDARAEACIGQKCSEWERCFITEMRRRGMESDIIIVNHHLFFADLAIKLQAEGAPDAGILPEAAAVIFDEAHELEDVAGNYFGISVSNLRVEDLARDVEASLQHNRMLSASLSGALGSLRERSQFFFSLLPPGEGRFAFETRREFLEENGDEFLALNQALTRLAGELEGLPQKPEEIFNFVRRAQELQVQLGFAMESDDRNTVFWIERRGGRGRANSPQRSQRRREKSRAGRTFFCRPRRSMSARSCANACGRSSSARFSLRRRSPSAADSNTSASAWDWSMRASRCCLRTSTTKIRLCFMCRPICPMRARRSSRRRPRSAFASCSKSPAAAPSCSSPAMRR